MSHKHLILVAILVILACTAMSTTDYKFIASPATDLQPLFHVRGTETELGWLGADCSTSFPICGENRHLYLWGDTLLGTITKNNTRKIEYFIRNSVAVATYPKDPKPDDFHFYWGKNSTTGLPDTLFVPPAEQLARGELYWVTCGAIVKEKLVLFAWRVGNNASEPLGFSILGTTWLLISNPQDDPPDWKYTSQDMQKTDDIVDWNTAVPLGKEVDDYVYIEGSVTKNDIRYATLGRIAIGDAYAMNLDKFEVWIKPGQWGRWSDVSVSDLIYLGPGAPENSVVWIDSLNQWATINFEAFQDPNLNIATADDLTGPWTSHGTIYTVPPPYNDTSQYLIYAPKIHPALSSDSMEIIFTYMTNALKYPQHFVEDLNLYTPQAVRVKIIVEE